MSAQITDTKLFKGFSAVLAMCSAVKTAAGPMTPPSDDTFMIRFMFYKETLHTFNSPEHVEEGWIIPTSPTKAIYVRPSEFLNHNAETIEQTPSGKMMVDFIKTHIIPKFVSDAVKKLTSLVQSSVAFEVKSFVDVRLRDTFEVRHLLDDEAAIDSMRCFLKATKRGTCAICIDDYEIGHDNGVRLPCSHGFQGTCISKWLVIKSRCPICSDRFLYPHKVSPYFNPPAQEGIWLSHSIIQG